MLDLFWLVDRCLNTGLDYQSIGKACGVAMYLNLLNIFLVTSMDFVAQIFVPFVYT